MALFRSLLRELRAFNGKPGPAGAAWRAACALLPSRTVGTLLGSSRHDGDSVFQRSILYHPSAWQASEDGLGYRQGLGMTWAETRSNRMASPTNGVDFRGRVRQHLRTTTASPVDISASGQTTGRTTDAAFAAAAVAVNCAAARVPLPLCSTSDSWADIQSILGVKNLSMVSKADDVKMGDLLVAHPSLTDEGLGGCVGIVLRHSPLDTLCLILNVDSGVDCGSHGSFQTGSRPHAPGGAASSNSQRPSWRLHVYLPPLAQQDPRNSLPASLQSVPLRWGGPHPVPLHLLHTVPLLRGPQGPQKECFQRLTGQQVYPGLWCSFADAPVVEAVRCKLENGEAHSKDFGAFVGMMCLEPDRLENYIRQNHWLVLHPTLTGTSAVPTQGWGRHVWGQCGEWIDDRQWLPWRAILNNLGGEFQDWAHIDWVNAM